MKSKSFDLKQSSSDRGKVNKSFDFVSLYKTAAETSKITGKYKTDAVDKENSFGKAKNDSRRETSPNLKKKKNRHEPLDISHINIDGPSLDSSLNRSSLNESKVTSTPAYKDKNKVKSIMKNVSEIMTDDLDESRLHSVKSKKRNKSVSFMLDDNEEVVKKKTKSEESLLVKKDSKQNIKQRKDAGKEKPKKKRNENKIVTTGDNANMETDDTQSDKNIPDVASTSKVNQEKKSKFKKEKKQKKEKSNVAEEETETLDNNENHVEIKKSKKKKRQAKVSQTEENGEPATKSRKTEVKPDVIAENLENLSIGDNPHTLTSLLDEMTVVDKDRKKKTKRKHKKDKPHTSVSSTEIVEDGAKEKIKWVKRKWNKDKKGDVYEYMGTSVIIENLPISIMCGYKKVLAEHFEKCGLIKGVGVAEMYSEDSNMVFTTTINFYSDGAATQALEEDGFELQGNHIRVKRALPPTQTTLVVRAYAALSDQIICSTFASAGKIRSIKHLVKGKKSIETVFVVFDGPESVEKALLLAKDVKVAGKKIHVAKFEVRKKKSKKQATVESENEGDSENSNE